MLSSLYRQSESGNPPLRIGLLLDSAELPSCFAEVVDHILQSNFVRLELLVFNAEVEKKAAEPPPKRSLLWKAIDLLRDSQRRQMLLFGLYQRWDRRNVVPSEDPHALVDCSARLKHVESISVTPIRKRFVHRFPADVIERIRERRLDVLIRFGFNILRGAILTASKYGVWSYHHGDGDYYRGGPAYFWELYEGNPISGAMLQVLTEELDAGKVLYKGLFATYPGISQARNRVQPYWGASTFMIQKLRELHHYGWEHIERNLVRPAPYLG
jgi:folate-dependent phosphoribosylglycinamide formyltransferase PurN